MSKYKFLFFYKMHRGYFVLLKMLKPYTDVLLGELLNLSYFWNPVNVMKRYLTSLSAIPIDKYELKRVHFLLCLITLRSLQLAVLCFKNPLHFENPLVWSIINVDTLSFKRLPSQFNLLHLSFGIEMLFLLYRMHFYQPRKTLNVVIQIISSVVNFKLDDKYSSKIDLFIDKRLAKRVQVTCLKYLNSTKYIIIALG